MVAFIVPTKSIRRAFFYNENKVEAKVAELLWAENFPGKTGKMTEWTKLNMLVKTAAINPNIKVNCVHISINFSPGDVLDTDKLTTIAREYMDGIGFGNQPYLVYQHHDAGHPHLHVVTTPVEADGKPINLHHLGKKKSFPACRMLEKKYGLVDATVQQAEKYELIPAYTPRVEYGKSETKKAIGIVLNGVLDTYKYASLPELNAVLKLYNVMADRGAEGSHIYTHKGLLYRVLDNDGNHVGVPIKASLFRLSADGKELEKPILANLEKRFLKNDVERQKKKSATRNAIDAVLRKHPGAGLKEVMEQLSKKAVDTVLRQNKDGVIYGITYVDHTTCCVFNGSALGKEYSAKGLLERCGAGIARGGQTVRNNRAQDTGDTQGEATAYLPKPPEQPESTTTDSQEPGLLEIMTRAEETYSYVPYDWRKKKKKKRKGLSR